MAHSTSRTPTHGRLAGPRGMLARAPLPNSPPLRLHLERCGDCGSRLGEPFEIRHRTITDLPPPKPLIFDVENPRYTCPGCHRRVEPPSPYARNRPFGFALMARVVHLRMLGLSVPKIGDCLREGHGVVVSPAAVLEMERQAAEALGPLYEGLKEQVRTVPVVHGDETLPDRRPERLDVGVLPPQGRGLSDRPEPRPGHREGDARKVTRGPSCATPGTRTTASRPRSTSSISSM